MNKGGFSLKRLLGVSEAKTKIAKKTGIPTTKSGREQKIGRAVGKGIEEILEWIRKNLN